MHCNYMRHCAGSTLKSASQPVPGQDLVAVMVFCTNLLTHRHSRGRRLRSDAAGQQEDGSLSPLFPLGLVKSRDIVCTYHRSFSQVCKTLCSITGCGGCQPGCWTLPPVARCQVGRHRNPPPPNCSPPPPPPPLQTLPKPPQILPKNTMYTNNKRKWRVSQEDRLALNRGKGGDMVQV